MANAFCEKALRYDLTVPFARFVVMHRNEIQLPFKRFQIQPVWRADRPQKGRYREFYQCDADIVGSDSLLNEVELVQIIDTVFSKFGINITVKINNRKILTGIAEIIGEPERIVDITVAIDKLENDISPSILEEECFEKLSEVVCEIIRYESFKNVLISIEDASGIQDVVHNNLRSILGSISTDLEFAITQCIMRKMVKEDRNKVQLYAKWRQYAVARRKKVN